MFSVVVKQLFKWYCPNFENLAGEERSWHLNLQDVLLKCENNSLQSAASVPLCAAVPKEGLIPSQVFPVLCAGRRGGAGSTQGALHSGEMPRRCPWLPSEL